MNLENTPKEKTIEMSVFNIKCAVRELLTRYKEANMDQVIDIEFGDIRVEPDGNEIVPIKLLYMNNNEEVTPSRTNGQEKS